MEWSSNDGMRIEEIICEELHENKNHTSENI